MDCHGWIRSRPTIVLGTCGVLIAGTTAGAFAQDDPARDTPAQLEGPTIELVVDAPTVTTVDLDRPGKSPGDLYAFRATVRDTAGTEVGRLLGSQTSIRLDGEAETVQAAATFELPGGQIVFGGLSGYPIDGVGTVVGRTYVRPILGGTGSYAGAGGTLTTTRRDDGRYEQRIALVPAPGGPATSLTALTRNLEAIDIPLGPADRREGDIRVFATTVVDAAGREVGRARGTQTTVSVDGDAETASASLTFDLPGGDLAVGGLSETPHGGGHLVAGRPFLRPVLGGTGRYAGMAGTVTSTQVEPGHYENRFELRPAGRPAGKLRVTVQRGPQRGIDLGDPGPSAGDLSVFAANVVDRRGRRAGRVHGTQTTIRSENGALTVHGMMTFDLKAGDLVVGGLSQYPRRGRGTRVGRAYVRPVLGGTGRYAGMRGTVRTIKRANGAYEQQFMLRRP
jgi:hypothetical protein